MDHDRLLRLHQVIKILGISRATFYAGIKVNRYPKPVKLGARAVAWRASDIAALVERGVER
ncbi:MAG: AlpA family phage regulatory protein [Rhizobiales bacterium]|nr:AlpA family phage regulatory protein [Hyphomicrobiales bacterium]